MTVGLVVTGGEVGQIITSDGSGVARQQGVREEESMGLLAEMRKLVSQAGLEEDVAEVFEAAWVHAKPVSHPHRPRVCGAQSVQKRPSECLKWWQSRCREHFRWDDSSCYFKSLTTFAFTRPPCQAGALGL